MQRRNFLSFLAGAASIGSLSACSSFNKLTASHSGIKRIEGTWFEFQHHSEIEGTYWDATLADFSEEDWDAKIKEIASTGIKYLVLLDVAIYDKAFYPSKLLPQHNLACADPLETVLKAADKYNLRFFISNGFFGNWRNPALLMKDTNVHSLRIQAMNELAEKYDHHKSFYGWYYPNETGINGHYDDLFMNYVNQCSLHARKLTPNAKILIAPYGTRQVKGDEMYVRQLDELDVDFIAYQDEVGVEKTKSEESVEIFKTLYDVHKKSGRSALWADVEVFKFEGKVYNSPLVPASSERIIKQLEMLSEFVEKIFIYQYIGLINKPGYPNPLGFDKRGQLYKDLSNKGYLR